MKIGFTGTREGMTQLQKLSFLDLVSKLKPAAFHHGDCVGSDDEAATIIHSLLMGTKIICHPPEDEACRAHNSLHEEIREPKTHFARNRDIVNECDVLIATPVSMTRLDRGGTWYTIGFAEKTQKPAHVIWPDGTVEVLD